MGDPGNKAQKDDQLTEFPRRERGRKVNQARDQDVEAGEDPGIPDKNWAGAGTLGTSADAPAMPVDREAEEEAREEYEE